MFRRPPHAPPPGPLGLDDLEAAPRPPLISRRAIGRAIALFLGGIAWGAAVRLADSLPVDAGFIAFVLKVGVGFVFVLAIAPRAAVPRLRGGPRRPGRPVRGRRGVDRAQRRPDGRLAGHRRRGVLLRPVGAGRPAVDGRRGRLRVGGRPLEGRGPAHGPIDGFVPPPRLTIDFLRKTMSLADGDGSTLIAVGNDAFVSPPDAPPRGEGDRSGVLDLALLQVNPESTPEDPVEVRAPLHVGLPRSAAGLSRRADGGGRRSRAAVAGSSRRTPGRARAGVRPDAGRTLFRRGPRRSVRTRRLNRRLPTPSTPPFEPSAPLAPFDRFEPVSAP